MNALANISTAKAALTQFLETDSKDKSKFRFTTDDRVTHVHNVQFEQGTERIFASRVQSLHKCAALDNVDGLLYFVETKNIAIDSFNDFGETPLHLAAHHGSMNAVRELHLRGADLNLQSQQKGWTPCHYAANSGHVNLVRLLAEFDANTVLQDKGGYTAAHLAAQCNQHEVLQTLHACQTSIPPSSKCLSTKSNNGLTPVHIAAHFDSSDCLKFLNESNCDMSVLDNSMETPAHKAARNSSQTCYRILKEECKVDVSLENSEGDTAEDLIVLCMKSTQASEYEVGPSQIAVNKKVKAKMEEGHLFESSLIKIVSKRMYGVNRLDRTPAEMRAEANLEKGRGVEHSWKPRPPSERPSLQATKEESVSVREESVKEEMKGVGLDAFTDDFDWDRKKRETNGTDVDDEDGEERKTIGEGEGRVTNDSVEGDETNDVKLNSFYFEQGHKEEEAKEGGAGLGDFMGGWGGDGTDRGSWS